MKEREALEKFKPLLDQLAHIEAGPVNEACRPTITTDAIRDALDGYRTLSGKIPIYDNVLQEPSWGSQDNTVQSLEDGSPFKKY